MLKIIYTIFLGLILALFIGLGISTFYEGPKQPEYPPTMYTPATGEGKPDEAQIQKDRDYEASNKKYEELSQSYSRNVSIIALVLSLVLFVSGLLFERKNEVIGGGILLGALFTLVYSIMRGFVSTDTKYTFIVVCFGVLLALYLGYHKFSHNMTVKKAKK